MGGGAGRDDGDDGVGSGRRVGGGVLSGDWDVVHAGVLVGGQRLRVDLGAGGDAPAEMVAGELLLGSAEGEADDVWDARGGVAAARAQREVGGDRERGGWTFHRSDTREW